MGQRLNIEIIEKGKCLANAYYHWSGYSSSAFDLTSQIIEAIPNIKDENPIRRAIMLLQETGAGLTDDEFEYAKELGLDNGLEFTKGRNEGLISVSEKGIDETERWSEADVYIYLDEERVDFDVFLAFDKDEQKELEEDCDINIKDLPIYDIDFSNVPFDKLGKLKKVVDDEGYFRFKGDDEYVYGTIE